METSVKELLSHSARAVEYILGEIARICRDMKPRAPGSEGEREAAEYMAGVLARDGGCRDVRIETFRARPAAFYGYFRFSAACGLLCVAGHFVHPWMCLVFGVLGQLLFLFQFVLYQPVIDRLFPERESVNVTAVRPCRGEVRQRLFLNGHIDAAWEFPLNYRFGGIVFEIPGVAALLGGLYYITLSLCRLCGAGGWTRIAGLWGLLFVPFFVLLGFTYNPRRVVDGANDDLSGCYMGIALLREMERLGIRPEHTEIGVVLTGCEEAGLRGAAAWATAHREDYRDVPTYILCFDTIHDPRHLMVNARDLNGTVAADPALCRAFLDAARAAGVPCREGMVPLFGGATDSAAFTRGGFRSAGVTGLNHVLEDYYHTRRDSWDNLDPEGLENCYRAAVMFIDAWERQARG